MGADEYNLALETRNKKKDEKRGDGGDGDGGGGAATREVEYKSWQDDPCERARRMWYWWKDKRPLFKEFSLAVRLVALVQVSSASVERLFSTVKLIREAIGDNMLEETLEARLLVLKNMVANGVYLSA